ncbi:hypothetical protein [Suttonella ornithocola]|uniref:Uncharacterized protein n=1 Tax=Suttonella ornithocola TaxID=279832 RepID=A0A380MUK8_9GAMM|nr:hypothetical protein [Suttonella ornithocola]SUO95037.1 Uncharacterised protein [Suttonella ornithocola]
MEQIEIDKMLVEMQKMNAEMHKMNAETQKIAAETRKLYREMWFYPIVLTASILTALALFLKAIVQIF